MSSQAGDQLKFNLKLAALLFVGWNIWALYKRIEFYMEHSFDILKPNIKYLINRY